MNNNLDNPFYYLENFRFVLAWVQQRYADLLEPDEADFIRQFCSVPIQSQALLVRMVMRRGNLFRASKLNYQEIGATLDAARELIDHGWVTVDPLITLEQLYGLLTKNEFARVLQLNEEKGAKKLDLLESVRDSFSEARKFSAWGGGEPLFEVCIADICDHIRLMFFGNLYQDWSEFVLADLGIFSFEKVPFSDASRAFHVRADIDIYLQLYASRERLQVGDDLGTIQSDVEAISCANPWLQRRRAKLLFQIGQEFERLADHQSALNSFARCNYIGARSRQIRVLEKLGQPEAALQLAQRALSAPESAEESQHLARIMPRLRRKLRLAACEAKIKTPPERIDLTLLRPTDGASVEEAVRRYLDPQSAASAPVYYVENTLINSLFGLLCWDAIFSPVPGAFFHPFQTGPADLHSADFRTQRAELFLHCLSQLNSQQYQQTIRDNFARKRGIQSPFVYWTILDETLLDHALGCFPAPHLEKWFERILDGMSSNRTGFPDLIQFWPQQQRYRMIEVKGPGDRLQDNQIRFLDFCSQHQMPVIVCYVEWESEQ